MTCNVEIFRQNDLIQSKKLDEALEAVLTPADLTSYYDNPTAGLDLSLLSSVTYKLNNLIKVSPLTGFNDLENRVGSYGVTVVELADMINKTQYTVTGLDILFTNTVNNGYNDAFADFLGQLDTYYGMNYGASIENGMCSAFGNIFNKINEVLEIIGDLNLLLSGGLQGFIVGKIKGLISDILSVKTVILKLIDKLSQKFLDTLEGLYDQISAFSENSYNYLMKKAEQAKEFFSDLNITKLKSVVEKAIKEMQDGFENAIDNPLLIPFLMYRVCLMTESVQSFLQNPINAFQTVLAGLNSNTLALESVSASSSAKATAAGAFRIPYAERIAARVSAATSSNRAAVSPNGSASVVPQRYATIPIKEEERQRIAQITSSGFGELIRFAPSVINMGKIAQDQYSSTNMGSEEWDPSENYEDAGWKHIVTHQPIVFIKIMRVAERMQNDGLLNSPLLIKSAFRSRWYNRIYQREIIKNKGAAWNSQHMQCNALDISTTASGHSPSKFIEYASQEGFKGLGVYTGDKAFIHVDLGVRRSWYGKGTISNDIKSAVYLHNDDRFRLG